MRRRPPSAQAHTTRIMREENRRTREAPRADRSRPAFWPLREVTFSFYGELEPSVSPRWSHPDGARIVEVLVLLDNAGTSTTRVALRLNATTTLVSIDVPAGSHRALWEDEDDEGIEVSRFDVLQALCALAGAGAESLTVQVRFA